MQKCKNWKSCKQSIVVRDGVCNKLLAALPIFAYTFWSKVQTLPHGAQKSAKSAVFSTTCAKNSTFALFGQLCH